jgi:chemotaxis protein MotD
VSLSSTSDRQDNTNSNSNTNRQPNDLNQQGAQQGQRGNDDRSQEQFYRQTRQSAPEEVNGNDISVQPETLPRDTSARPDHVYL